MAHSTRRSRVDCPGCNRKFRTEGALQMHLGRNPTHGGPTGEYWHGEWVLKPNTVETFRHLPATGGRRALRVTHDTVAQDVHISGPTQVTLDTSPVADDIVGEPDYELRGDYLIVSFDRASG